MISSTYTAELLSDNGTPADIRIRIGDKTWHLWGRKGAEREKELAARVDGTTLPVLIGSGLGVALQHFLERKIPVAVVDRERAIQNAAPHARELTESAKVLWLDKPPNEAMDTLLKWQQKNGNLPFSPVIMPLYLRLDREYYGSLVDTLKQQDTTDFWSQARYPKFENTKPRVLFFDASYFLCGEIQSGLDRLGVEFRSIEVGKSGLGSQTFIENLLKSVIDFRPDFVLTVNHFGLDRQGKLAGLLADLGLPLASWFVDNPHLILHEYEHPGSDNAAIFTYDFGNIDQLRHKGFPNVHYLPLATDPHRFSPSSGLPTVPAWQADVSFVGNSMLSPVTKNLSLAGLSPEDETGISDIAAAFGESGFSCVEEYFKKHAPQWDAILRSLPTPENRLALESLVTWEATRQYRLRCVESTLPFSPLIVGDEGWLTQLTGTGWRHLGGLDYYVDLPHFYPQSAISFNCTSRQMIGAVNQRVFDVPACGGFVLTDHREQMEALFDPGTEVAVYHHPEEIPERMGKYLQDEDERRKISKAARKRILAEHTYEIRLAQLIKTMRLTFSSGKRS